MQPFQGGLKIYDISKPEKPLEIAFFKTGGKGVHRFTIHERYAYISTELDGYRGGFTMILDVKDPERPEEVARWWLPGQWIAGRKPRPGKVQPTTPITRCVWVTVST